MAKIKTFSDLKKNMVNHVITICKLIHLNTTHECGWERPFSAARFKTWLCANMTKQRFNNLTVPHIQKQSSGKLDLTAWTAECKKIVGGDRNLRQNMIPPKICLKNWVRFGLVAILKFYHDSSTFRCFKRTPALLSLVYSQKNLRIVNNDKMPKSRKHIPHPKKFIAIVKIVMVNYVMSILISLTTPIKSMDKP